MMLVWGFEKVERLELQVWSQENYIVENFFANKNFRH